MKRVLFSLSLLVALSACNTTEIYEKPQSSTSQEEGYTQHPDAADGILAIYVTEDLAAQFEQGAITRSTVESVISSESLLKAGITSIERMFPYAGKFEARTREDGLHRWYNVTFDKSASLTRVANDFFEMDGILKVENRLKSKTFNEKPTILPQTATRSGESEGYFFNDPRLFQQWHYKNNGYIKGFDAEGFIKGMDINVEPVWSNGISGRPEVVVAIVDGGIDYDHPDLAQNMHINEAELNGVEGEDDDNNGFVDDIYGYNFVNRDATITPHDHGTHVAGTVAAVNNNGIGVAGVAGGNGDPSTGIRMISCQMLHHDEETGMDQAGDMTAAAEAIKYGADAGAIISQNSWGYTVSTIMSYDTEAIDYFAKYAGIDEDGNQVGPMKGGIVLFAAGNDKVTYSNPGQHPTAVCVTSISPDGLKAPYSNYGEWADIAAPGGEKDRWEAYVSGVLSTLPVGKYADDYGSFTGTSMACPHVSGTVALYLSKRIEEGTTEGLTPDEVINRLLTTTRSLVEWEPEYYDRMGSGLLDATRFVGIETDAIPEAVTDLKVKSTTYTSLLVEWSVPAGANGYTIFYSKNSLEGVDFDNLPEGVSSLDVNKFVNAEGKMESTIADLLPETEYNIAIRSWNYGDKTSEVSGSIVGTTDVNYAPQYFKSGVLIDGSVDVVVAPDSQVKISYEIKDPEAGEFSYEYFSSSDAESAPIYNKTTKTLTVYIVGSKAPVGDYQSKVEATDKYGAVGTLLINYTIEANEPPTIVKPIEDIKLEDIATVHTISLEGVFEDKHTPLTYAVGSYDESVAQAKIVDNSSVEITTKGYGSTQLVVSATDALGEVSRCEFTVACSSSTGVYEVVLYPNPVISTLNIKSDAVAIDRVDIYNSRGAKVMSQEGDERSMDLESLAKGVYTVDVVIEGKSNTKSISKL